MPCFSFIKRKNNKKKNDDIIEGELSDDDYEFLHRRKYCTCICMKCYCYNTTNYHPENYPIPDEAKQHYI